MHRVSIGGKDFELSENDYLRSISNLAEGYYILAEGYYNYHVSGFADWKGIFQMPDVGQKDMEKAIAEQIDDDELSIAYNSLKEQLEKINEVDRQIAKWLAGYVGLSSVENKKDKANLERRLNKIIVNGPGGRYQGPVWAMHPEYQALVEKSKEILAVISETHRQIDQRIQQLLESSTGA